MTPSEARKVPIEAPPSHEEEVTKKQIKTVQETIRKEQEGTTARAAFEKDDPDTLQSFRL